MCVLGEQRAKVGIFVVKVTNHTEQYPLIFVLVDINVYGFFLIHGGTRETFFSASPTCGSLDRFHVCSLHQYPVSLKKTLPQTLWFPYHPGTTFAKDFCFTKLNVHLSPTNHTLLSTSTSRRSGSQDTDKMPPSAIDIGLYILQLWWGGIQNTS